MENNSNELDNIHISITDGEQQNKNQFSNNFGNSISFPIFCTFCKKSPLFPPIFFCKDCKYIYCSQCEQYNGYKHYHPYYQIKTITQYEYLKIGQQSEFDKFFDNVGNKMESAYKSVLNFFGANTSQNDENNNNNNNNININFSNLFEENEVNNPYDDQNRI